jgi:ribonuclease HI
MSTDQAPVVLYFDGLCEPNPGGWATFAWVALARDGSVVGQGGKISPPTRTNTNNWAEYSGLNEGLLWLQMQGVTGIRVRGDSQLVVKQVTGEWACNAPALRELHAEAVRRLGLTQSTLEGVPREKNHRADALCFELLPVEARPVVEAAIARRQQLRGRR